MVFDISHFSISNHHFNYFSIKVYPHFKKLLQSSIAAIGYNQEAASHSPLSKISFQVWKKKHIQECFSDPDTGSIKWGFENAFDSLTYFVEDWVRDFQMKGNFIELHRKLSGHELFVHLKCFAGKFIFAFWTPNLCVRGNLYDNFSKLK